MSEKLKLPTADGVAEILKGERNWIVKHGQEEIDVRLQVYEDGKWAIRAGCSDYDQDHRGYWGASSVFGTDTDEALLSTAEELLDQAADHAASNGVEVED